MTYIKCPCTSVKVYGALFWGAALLLSIFIAPAFSVFLALLGMLNFAYLTFNPVPLPIVLALSAMAALSLYIAYMSNIHIA